MIELLVVIAIIGVLSGVVLSALNSARARAGDVSIQSTLAQIRVQSELFYDGPYNYGAVVNDGSGNPVRCDTAIAVPGSLFADPVVSRQITDAQKNSNQPWTEVMCISIGSGMANGWALSVPFRSDSAKHWCVDDVGSTRQIGAKLSAGQTSCP